MQTNKRLPIPIRRQKNRFRLHGKIVDEKKKTVQNRPDWPWCPVYHDRKVCTNIKTKRTRKTKSVLLKISFYTCFLMHQFFVIYDNLTEKQGITKDEFYFLHCHDLSTVHELSVCQYFLQYHDRLFPRLM